MTNSDIAGNDHIDVCIADEPTVCEGDCYEAREAEVRAELADIATMRIDSRYDLTVETEARLDLAEERLEDELYRLTRV